MAFDLSRGRIMQQITNKVPEGVILGVTCVKTCLVNVANRNIQSFETLTLYRPMTCIHVINEFSAKRPMTRIHVMGTLGVCFEHSGLLATIYTLKDNVTRRKSLSQSTGPTLSQPISGSTQAMKMK